MGSIQSGTERGLWRLGTSKIHGMGVLLNRPVRAGTLIGVGIGYRWRFVPAITSDFGAWINHSYTPSASLLFINGNHWVVANRALDTDDEVTVDYRKTPFYVDKPKAHYK